MIIYNILGKLYEILFKSYVKTSVSSLKKRLAGGVEVVLLGLTKLRELRISFSQTMLV